MATIPDKSDRIEAVFRRGVRYEPAWKHYGTDTTVVTCDRCGASALQVCIGLDDTDLCIKCFDELKERTEQVGALRCLRGNLH